MVELVELVLKSPDDLRRHMRSLIEERDAFKAAAEEATNNMRATVDAYAKLLNENAALKTVAGQYEYSRRGAIDAYTQLMIEYVALKAEAEKYRRAHHALLDSIAHGAPVQAQIKPLPLNALRHSEPVLPWER